MLAKRCKWNKDPCLESQANNFVLRTVQGCKVTVMYFISLTKARNVAVNKQLRTPQI